MHDCSVKFLGSAKPSVHSKEWSEISKNTK